MYNYLGYLFSYGRSAGSIVVFYRDEAFLNS